MPANGPASILNGVAVAGAESGSTLPSVELRRLGGALAQSSPEHGAIDTLDAEYAYFGVGMAPAPHIAAAQVDPDRIGAMLAPYDAGRYANFTERPA